MGSNVKESDYMTEMKSLTLNDKTYDGFVDPVARTLASATAVIESASGESVTVSDASDVNLYGLRIFGKTTQDGIPTPDAPVDLVSVGSNGSITVGVTSEREAQSMTIATPNGLPGIPVASGGNYTDADGQQWVCDEIDCAMGVREQRCRLITFDATEPWIKSDSGNVYYLGGRDFLPLKDAYANDYSSDALLVCNRYSPKPYKPHTEQPDCVTYMYRGAAGNSVSFKDESITTIDEWKEQLANWYSDGTPLQIVVRLETPIETPLSVEEIAAYKELHTYREPTTVSNNDGAYMELEYVMDAKKYINSIVGTGGGAAPARLSSVTIHASAWNTESDGLHSQVVAIPGVTEYSKVDLLPSVEQLAVFRNKDVAFVTENENGVVTVFAIGDKPILDYTMQVSITEVTA
jgi:hypothetical protein